MLVQKKHTVDLSGVNILIAEDDPISMLIVSKMLDIKNASVLEAENGAEAIELLDEAPNINVVLLDRVTSPGSDFWIVD